MNTIEELLYYCREIEPVGALLLSGEWGCGKTYLIDHELKETLNGEAVVLRVSLFGITLPEEIHNAVKNAWMEAYCEIKGVDGRIIEKIGEGKNFISKLDFLPDWVKNITSMDLLAFFSLKNEIEGKYVVLVFDDLERCRMNSVNVLGVINDYCENGGYHTIIVTNQDKMDLEHKVPHITGEIQFVAEGASSKGAEKTVQITLDLPPTTGQGELS